MSSSTQTSAGIVDAGFAYKQGAARIYQEAYAAEYSALYIEPWRQKHELNARNLARVLGQFPDCLPDWLDLACGQAWHFSLFPGRARMLGLDLSEAQLLHARRNAPQAKFVRGDMAHINFPANSFHLITSFWAAYCYLGSHERIARLLSKAVAWLRTEGTLYLEVLIPQDLESFNVSHFSKRTGFAVVPRSDDFVEWQYDDSGGRHIMTSPPLNFFIESLSPHFQKIEAVHDSGFMVHLIATGKKSLPSK